MGEVFKFNISEIEAFSGRLTTLGEKVGRELEGFLNDEGQTIATVAKELVPVDLGNLRASIKVEPPVGAFYALGELMVSIVAGDTAVQYAQAQEDNETFHHTVGQAHYMRDAVVKTLVGIKGRLIEKLMELS